MQCTWSVGTLVLRLLQAAQARETRARFGCDGGASTLGEAAGRRGRRGRAAALSPEIAGLVCCGCITHETAPNRGCFLLLLSRNLQAISQSKGRGGFKTDSLAKHQYYPLAPPACGPNVFSIRIPQSCHSSCDPSRICKNVANHAMRRSRGL